MCVCYICSSEYLALCNQRSLLVHHRDEIIPHTHTTYGHKSHGSYFRMSNVYRFNRSLYSIEHMKHIETMPQMHGIQMVNTIWWMDAVGRSQNKYNINTAYVLIPRGANFVILDVKSLYDIQTTHICMFSLCKHFPKCKTGDTSWLISFFPIAHSSHHLALHTTSKTYSVTCTFLTNNLHHRLLCIFHDCIV